MKLAIVGGLLQGIEAVYLAKKAVYETLVIDRRAAAPATFIADESVALDIQQEPAKTKKLLADCDAVIPANENLETLIALAELSKEAEINLLFDLNAYQISSSKILSNRLINDLHLPLPQPWPACGFPAIVKPSGQSGSIGVKKVMSDEEITAAIAAIHQLGDQEIIQEYVAGPNVSIEMIGDGQRAEAMVVTEVVLDDHYDCKMVRCPLPQMEPAAHKALAEYGRALAEAVSLKGIMDLEAIYSPKGLKILEIDARLPSQTPAAVVNATGVNLLQHLVEAAQGRLSAPQPTDGAAIYEHLAFDNGVLRSCGEKTFAAVKAPRLEQGLFGASEMITDYEAGKSSWRATMINTGKTPAAAWQKRQNCLERLLQENDIKQYIDPVPEVVT